MKTFPVNIYASKFKVKPSGASYEQELLILAECSDIKALFEEVLSCDLRPELFAYIKKEFEDDKDQLREELGL